MLFYLLRRVTQIRKDEFDMFSCDELSVLLIYAHMASSLMSSDSVSAVAFKCEAIMASTIADFWQGYIVGFSDYNNYSPSLIGKGSKKRKLQSSRLVWVVVYRVGFFFWC